MILRLILLCMHRTVGDRTYRSDFDYHAFFVGYYLSKQLGRIKIETDGTFNRLFIVVGGPPFAPSYFDKALSVYIPFDRNYYDGLVDVSSKCEYYISLLRTGLDAISRFKAIPYNQLMELTDELIAKGFECQWQIKKLFIRDYNINIEFSGRLNTQEFILWAIVTDRKTKSIIGQGKIVRTRPDSIFFSKLSKFRITDDKVFISSNYSDYFFIRVENIVRGKIVVEFCASKGSEEYNSIQDYLIYEGNEF